MLYEPEITVTVKLRGFKLIRVRNLHDPTDPDKFYKPMNWQHFTMYLFFGLYGFFRLALSFTPDLLTGT